MDSYKVVIPYSVFINCDEELMYINRYEDIDNGRITEFTEKDLKDFIKNNITLSLIHI